MVRVFVVAASLTLISAARADNPILAADLVGRYWAYKDKCESAFGALTKEEVGAISRIAGALGYDANDSDANSLAHESKTRHIISWVGKGEVTTCVETRVFLRGLAKKLLQ